MLNQEIKQNITRLLPFLQDSDTQIARDFFGAAYGVRLAAGSEIFDEGDFVDGIALLVSGVVRVYKISETGREITLYRFGRGESCVITANAILNTQNFPAIAVVEDDAEAVMIPADSFSQWVQRYGQWRDFVFNLFSQRLASVMEVLDEVAFQRMDRRLASFLLERASSGNPIAVTHQEIANELGSSREVISRLLEDFAQREILELTRGEIKVLDFAKLEAQLTL